MAACCANRTATRWRFFIALGPTASDEIDVIYARLHQHFFQTAIKIGVGSNFCSTENIV
jgi:hypothetical protein